MMTVMIDDCTTHSVHPDPLEHVRYSSPPSCERRILLLNISIKYKNYTLSNGTPIDNLHGYHYDLHRPLYFNIPRSSFLYVALLPGQMVVAAALLVGGGTAYTSSPSSPCFEPGEAVGLGCMTYISHVLLSTKHFTSSMLAFYTL